MARPCPAMGAKTALGVLLASLLTYACSDDVEPCALSEERDGHFRLRCPDGTSGTFLPPESRGAPAVVKGTARRLGEASGGGIEVTLLPTFSGGTTFQAHTEDDGSYRFDDVPSGTYHLIFRSPSYPELMLWQRTILPGTLLVDPVVLRPTKRIGPIPAAAIHVAPTQDAFVAHEKTQGRLLYWDERHEEALLLGEKTGRPEWLPSGERLLFLDAFNGISGTLVLYDRARGTSEALMSDVEAWMVSEDEQVVMARQTQGKLSSWRALDGEVTTIVNGGVGFATFHQESKVAVAIVTSLTRPGSDVLVWDAVAGTGSLLGRALSEEIRFDGRGELLLYRSSGGHFLWGREFSSPRPVGNPQDMATMGPDGRFVILRRSTFEGQSVEAFLVETGEIIPIASSRIHDGFDPRTGSYWVVNANPPSFRLFHGDGSLETIHTWASDQFFPQPLFPKGSGKIFFVLGSFNPVFRNLWVWEPGGTSQRVAEGLEEMPSLIAGDSHLLFQTDAPRLMEIASGSTRSLRATGDVTQHVGSHATGLFHYPITPLYSAFQTVGAMAVHDTATHSEGAVADEVYQETCRFSPVGELHCLNRRSPIAPHGAQLVVWDREEQSMRRILDGVFAFGFADTGTRAWISSQAPEGDTAPMLWLRDAETSSLVAIDAGMGAVALTESWIAYSIPEGDRAGLYVSRYPRPAMGDEP